MKRSTIAILPTLFALGACGGSSTPATTHDVSAADVRGLVTQLGDTILAESATDASDLPAANATYSGFFGANSTLRVGSAQLDPFATVGVMTLEVDFDTNQLSGTADNLYDDNNTPLDTELTFTGTIYQSKFGGTEREMSLTMTGSGLYGTVDIDASFAGDDAQYITGLGTTVRPFSFGGTSGTTDVTVGFGLEK